MRSIRKLALLGLAALMVCAAVASAASAGTVENAATGVAYTGGVTGQNSGAVTLNTNWVGKVTCTSSSISGTITSNNPVVGSISAASWTNGGTTPPDCTSNIGDCTTAAVNLNWDATAVPGTMTVSDPSYVGANVVCGGTNCTFGASSVSLALTNGTATTDATAVANATLSLQSGSIFTCGTSATWNATYTLWGTTGGHIHLKVV